MHLRSGNCLQRSYYQYARPVPIVGRLLILIFLLALGAIYPVSAIAQVTNATGTIQGTVVDASGAVVPNAKITLTQPSTGLTKSLTTNGSGFYSGGSLVPGDYTIRVESAGFAVTQEKITVTVGNVANGDIKLGLASSAQEVEVQANAVQVDTAQTTVQGVLEDINAPTSPYGSSQESTVAGRVLVVQGRFLF